MRPIGHTTKFKLSKDHSFHTIGSRFAREREIVLTALGVSLAAADAVSPWAWFDPRTKYLPTNVAGTDVAQTWQRSSLNGYSAHSMLYDIKRVLERSHSLEQTAILIVGECEVQDPQLKTLIYDDLAFTQTARRVLDSSIASDAAADVIIMTLSMTETWMDEQTAAILPTPPQPLQIKRFPERLSFFNADYDSVSAALWATIDKIARHNAKSPWVILTISPVPTGSTFTAKDVILANSYSKATLVFAAQSVAAAYPKMDYFPSYEMMVNSSRDIWFPYAIHIRPEYVAEVMKAFLGSYLDTQPLIPVDTAPATAENGV